MPNFLLCDDVIPSAPAATRAVGIDAGINSLVTLSTGDVRLRRRA